MFQVLSNLSKVSKQKEEGQGLVEYALILVLVAVVVVVVLSLVGPAVGNIFSEVVSVLNGNVEDVGDVCIGDIAPPTEYYLFEGGNNIIEAPARYYTDSDCTTSGGTFNITVIKNSVSKAEADQICQARYSVNASVNAPGDIWYCS